MFEEVETKLMFLFSQKVKMKQKLLFAKIFIVT
jgi:hypothetical protein